MNTTAKLLKICCLAVVIGLLPWSAKAEDLMEPHVIQADEIKIEEVSDHTFTIELPEYPADADLVLEFTAWYQAPRRAGYYATLGLLWNGEELQDILDRPATFATSTDPDRPPTPIRRGNFWQVPVLPYPEAAYETGDRYFVDPEVIDVVTFRFRLPYSTPGLQELTVRNRQRAGSHPTRGYEYFPNLMLRDVKIRFEEKE